MSIFSSWYTDTVDVYRVVNGTSGNLTTQERKQVGKAIPCRVYSTQKNGPSMTDNAAQVNSTDKLSCAVDTDIQAGDELFVIRGGAIGRGTTPERYFAGNPQHYYDPVGGALTGLEHLEVGLLMNEIIGGGNG